MKTGFQMLSGGTRARLAKRGATEIGVRMDAFSARLETDEPLASLGGRVSGGAPARG